MISAASPLPRAAPSRAPGFDVLDDVVRVAGAHGLIVARTGGHEAARALLAHAARRAAGISRRSATGPTVAVDSVWRDVAARLGLGVLPEDPEEAARALDLGAGRDAALVAVARVGGAWDDAVTRALAARNPESALFVVVELAGAELGLDAPRFVVGDDLDAAARERWWSALTTVLASGPHRGLAALGALADRAPLAERRRDPSPEAARWLARLGLARRAWPAREHAALGEGVDPGELEHAGWLSRDDGWLSAHVQLAVDDEDRRVVASALEAVLRPDPWAQARAAELWSEVGEVASSNAAMRRAFDLTRDATTRPDLWRRWEALLTHQADAAAWLSGAELALALGDVDVAAGWAERSGASGAGGRAAWVLARASLAKGDLVRAEAALDAATPGASRALLAEVALERAELCYTRGDLEGARRLADALLETPDAPTRARLGARNLLGKLHLAAAEWAAAEAHFARDACDAAIAGESTAELRARVNRAIALLSRGAGDEARPMLESVLADGERAGEQRAVGFALSNLAVLAIERHDYAGALDLSERSLAVRRRLGDRLGFARDVVNLVELRLRLGLVEQAEQALRFGRQALGAGAPRSRLAELALAAARIRAARGATLEAERELAQATRNAASASDGDKLGECQRLGVRLALEDGAVARARELLVAAEASATAPYAIAESALLAALVDLAAGRDAATAIERALGACHAAGDADLTRDAHVLAGEAALRAGDGPQAARHAGAARALADAVSGGLTSDVARAFLARSELVRLAQLERALSDDDSGEPEPSVARPTVSRAPVELVGRHPAVRALWSSAQRVGRSNATVLVRGESGTGKELVAEALHRASTRADGPLVKVNCGALLESLLLSELFGHERGAFTGAGSRKIGRFERAHGGTLFLDEIGDISPRTQVALLRVLEERRIERVGGTSSVAIDVRVVCATHRDLAALVARGEFREDLFYRLSGITLETPPLRERLSDLPLLAESLLQRIASARSSTPRRLSPEALELLAQHRWPGNVRELENALSVASLFADGDVIEPAHLRDHVAALRQPAAPAADAVAADVAEAAYREVRQGRALGDLKRSVERDCIARALTETSGNITRAATLLGMKRPRLSQLVKQYDLLATVDEEEA